MGGEEMPDGEEGEVCVSGPCVMQGYKNLPEASAEVFFDVDGERSVKHCMCIRSVNQG